VKKKDLVFLVVAVCILLVAGYLVYSQLLPKKASTTSAMSETVETVGVIPNSIDTNGLSQMTQSNMQDFNSIPQYDGLNNTEPFGQ
jgi:hypothetical protein